MDLLSFLASIGGEVPLSSSFGQWCRRVSQHVDAAREQIIELNDRSLITQANWFVDASSGSDDADGASWSTALKTLPELGRRTLGVFSPDVTPTISLRGSFVDDPLSLHSSILTPGPLATVQGEMTTLREGVISAYQAFAAPTTRASFQDSGLDFTPYVGKRVRVLDGPAAGAVTTIADVSGASALIGQFISVSETGVHTVNPVAGNGYAIEEFATEVPGYVIDLFGARPFALRDLRVRVPVSGRSSIDGAYRHFGINNVFGCEFLLASNAVLNLTGSATYGGNRSSGATLLFIGAGTSRLWGHVGFNPITVSDGHYQAAANNLHQGATASISVDTGGTLEDLAQRCLFGYSGSSAAFNVSSLGRYFQLNSSSRLWGAVANSIAARVGAGCVFQYVSVPQVTGTTTDIQVGNTGKSWASLPYIDIGAGTGNTGAMAVQGP